MQVTLELQQALNDNLAFAAERGDIKEARQQLLHGAKLEYRDTEGYGVMDYAVANGRISFVKFLISIGLNDPVTIGRALITTECADVLKTIARYNPDCTVINDSGWTAYEVMLINKNYDLIEAYKQSGLPIPPLNLRMLQYINRNHDLKTWSIATGINVPDVYYHQMETLRYDKKHCSRLYKRITKELTANAA